MLYCSVLDLGWKTGGMSITSKDAERNGNLMIGSKLKRGGTETRFKIFNLASTLKFSRYANQAQDVTLLFLASVDASVDQDDNDVIMACLADMGSEEREAGHKRELREIAAQILADENCVVVV